MGSFHRPPQLNDGTFRERKQEEGGGHRSGIVLDIVVYGWPLFALIISIGVKS